MKKLMLFSRTFCSKKRLLIGSYESNVNSFDLLLNKLKAFSVSEITILNFNITLQSVKILNNIDKNLIGRLICIESLEKNPDMELVHKNSIEWAEKVGLIKSINAREKLDSTKFSGLVSTALRGSSQEDLQVLVNFVTCFTLLDDIIDNHLPTEKYESIQVRTVLKVLLDVLKGCYNSLEDIPNLQFPFPQAFCFAIFDIYNELNKRNLNLSHFHLAVEEFLNGAVSSFEQKVAGKFSSEEEYLSLRESTVGIKSAFELCCSLKGLIFQEEDYSNSVLVKIIRYGTRVYFLLNDLVSFSKEFSEINSENFVSVRFKTLMENNSKLKLENDAEQLLEQAFKDTLELCNQELCDLLILKEQIPKDNVGFSEYYNIVVSFIRDSIDWHFKETKRYKSLNIQFKEETISSCKFLIS